MHRVLFVALIASLAGGSWLYIRSNSRRPEYEKIEVASSTTSPAGSAVTSVAARTELPPSARGFAATIQLVQLDATGSTTQRSAATHVRLSPVQEAGARLDVYAQDLLVTGGRWTGFLSDDRWSIALIWDDDRVFVHEPAEISLDSPSAVVALSLLKEQTFSATDCMTGAPVKEGWLLYAGSSPGGDFELSPEGYELPPPDTEPLAEGPLPLTATRGPGTYWFGASGYLPERVFLDRRVFSTSLCLTPLAEFSVLLIDPSPGEGDLVRLTPRWATRESQDPSMHAWRSVGRDGRVHYRRIAAGEYDISFRSDGLCERTWGRVWIGTQFPAEIVIDGTTLASPCASLEVLTILPRATDEGTWTIQLGRLQEERFVVCRTANVKAGREDLPGIVFSTTWEGVEPGAYVVRALPSNTCLNVQIAAGQTTSATLDLSDARDITLDVMTPNPSASVIVDWSYEGDPPCLKQSLAAKGNTRMRLLCNRRRLLLSAYSDGAASGIVEVEPEALENITVPLELKPDRAAEIDLVLLNSHGITTACPTFFGRLVATPIGHAGRFVYGRNERRPHGEMTGYGLVFSEEGTYSLTLWERPVGSPNNSIVFRREVHAGGGRKPLVVRY